MTDNINVEGTEVQYLNKGFIPSSSDAHSLIDFRENEVDQREILKPQLFTALFGGNDRANVSNSFLYDKVIKNVQLPDHKQFTSRGNSVEFDKQDQIAFAIGSQGFQANFGPQDMARQRKPGSVSAQKDVAYYTAMLDYKLNYAWSIDEELHYTSAIISDTNRVTVAGMATQYNFFTAIEGVTRKAYFDSLTSGNAVLGTTDGSGRYDTLFATNPDVITYMNALKELLEQEASKAGVMGGRVVALCGTNWFNKRLKLERQEGLARDIRMTTKDFVQEVVPSVNYGGYNYSSFEGAADNIFYIKVPASINGTLLVPTNEFRLMMVGGNSPLEMNFAPAMTMSAAGAGAPAQSMYRWTFYDDFQGYRQVTESNRFALLKKPTSIIWGISST